MTLLIVLLTNHAFDTVLGAFGNSRTLVETQTEGLFQVDTMTIGVATME